MKTLDQLQRYTPVSEWDGEHATRKDPQGEYVKLSDVEAMLADAERKSTLDALLSESQCSPEQMEKLK